jgi:hypothetical protein
MQITTTGSGPLQTLSESGSNSPETTDEFLSNQRDAANAPKAPVPRGSAKQ